MTSSMPTYSRILSCAERLRELWDPEVERCGTLTKGLKITEVENLAEDPANQFKMTMAQIEKGFATWHSHPRNDANLSMADWTFFLSWPEKLHFIVHSGEVRLYYVEDGIVYQVDDEEEYNGIAT